MKSTFASIISIAWLFAGYFALPLVLRASLGFLGTVAGAVNDKSRGGFDRLKNFRKGQQQSRGQNWKEGSLYRDNRFARPLNAIGKRVGAAQAGGGVHAFLGTQRGRTSRSLYEAQVNDARLKRSPLLNELQNFDQANAVLGLSGGTEQGLRQAARDIFTNDAGVYDEETANAAMAGARAVGVNRANASTALKTTMANKARAISAGNVGAVDRGVRRLARNAEEYSAFGEQAAAVARGSGRADLGGRAVVQGGYDRTGDAWVQARAAAPGIVSAAAARGVTLSNEQATYQTLADRNMLDGIDRTAVHAMMGGHGAQAQQAVQSLSRVLNTAPAGSQERLHAAMALKEFQGGLPGASAGVRDAINEVLYSPAGAGPNGAGLGLNPEMNIADQLASRTGITGLTAQGLTTMGRTYPEQADPSRTGAVPGSGVPPTP